MSLDYRPDTPFAPNILNTAVYLMPDKAGNYRTPYSASAITGWTGTLASAIATDALGARMVQLSDGTPNLFVGNATKLIEVAGITTSDVTRTVGGAYATGSNRWWFCTFGDSIIASNYADATQVRTSSTFGAKFAALSNAPKAKFFLSQSGYLLACNYDDGTAAPNGVKWATEGSTTTWTAATGNTAGNAILRQSPGAIVAGAEIHDIVVIWKKNSMYVGRVIGGAGTAIWQFNLLSPKIGCASQEAWVTTPVGIIFVSTDNGIYRFDGSIPIPIDRGFRQEFRRTQGTVANIQLTHDEASQSVFVWCGTTCYAYNYMSDKWGLAYQTALGNASFTTFKCGVRDANHDDYVTLGGTSVSSRRCHLIITSERNLCNLSSNTAGTGINASFSITTFRHPTADPDHLTLLSRVIPIFAYDTEDTSFTAEAATGTLTVRPKSRIGAVADIGTAVSLDSTNRRWDMKMTANTFQLAWTFTAEKFILVDMAYATSDAGMA